jgi:hypothetical protein
VKTPFDAVVEWYKIKPEIFNETPDMFQTKTCKIFGQRTQTRQLGNYIYGQKIYICIRRIKDNQFLHIKYGNFYCSRSRLSAITNTF